MPEPTISARVGPENLHRAELTVAERALFTRRRKEAYEALHPETKQTEMRNGGLARKVCDPENTVPRFTADTAAGTGRNERAVQLDAESGEKIDPDVLEASIREIGLQVPVDGRPFR